MEWSVAAKWPPEKRHHMLLPVSSYIAIRAEDHDDRAEKDRAKEDDDDKGAVNKLIRGRWLTSVTRIDLMKQPRADSQ